MKWIVRGLIGLLGFALIAVAGASWYVWSLGADAVARGRAAGWVAETESKPLTVFEQTVAKAEFGETWNRSGFPCRTVANLLARGARTSAPISYFVARDMGTDTAAERTLQAHFTIASVACQLEGSHADAALLRLWLKNLRITTHGTMEATSQALLGKPTAALDEGEAARMAVLLSAPGAWQQPETWTTRAEYVLAKSREYVWAGDKLERRDAGTP